MWKTICTNVLRFVRFSKQPFNLNEEKKNYTITIRNFHIYVNIVEADEPLKLFTKFVHSHGSMLGRRAYVEREFDLEKRQRATRDVEFIKRKNMHSYDEV